jgi:hypothetical protein
MQTPLKRAVADTRKTNIVMKRLTTASFGIIGATMLISTYGSAHSKAQTVSGTSSPALGVICDEARGVCYDRFGPSKTLTESYLGKKAANRLKARQDQNSEVDYIMLSNGILCDLEKEQCWSDGWRRSQGETTVSQQLFGRTATSSGGTVVSVQGLQTPEAGIACDPRSKTCFNQSGLSFEQTRKYFGLYAEQDARRKWGNRSSQQQFQLSNGSYCDTKSRICWSDGMKGQNVNLALTNQLFDTGSVETGQTDQSQSTTSQLREAQCSITSWLQTQYRGRCQLQETSSAVGRLLEVSLQDGSRFTIRRPWAGNFEITDQQGKTWPLQVRDEGRLVSFSWSDKMLTVNDQGISNSGFSLRELIDSLLRR